MVSPPATTARPYGPDIETLVDGPTAYGDWNARERKRRWDVIRLGLRLVGLVWALIAFQLFVTREPVTVLLCALGLVYALLRAQLGAEGASACVYLILALYGAFAVVAGTALHYARHPAVASGLVAVTAVVAAGTAMVLSDAFVGWCCAVQDRDILVRRRWRRAWQMDKSPRGATLRQAVAILYGKCMGPLGAFFTVFAADPLGKVAPYAPLFPFAVFLIGCVVSLLTRAATPWGLLRVSVRSVVVWLTYAANRREPTGAGTYRLTPPFSDPLLRRLLVAFLVLLATLSAIAVTRWPTPIKEVPTAELALPGFTRDLFCVAILRVPAPRTPPPSVAEVIADSYLPFAATAVGMTVIPALYLFLTFAGSAGPALALYYREFAENAVANAERSSRREQ